MNDYLLHVLYSTLGLHSFKKKNRKKTKLKIQKRICYKVFLDTMLMIMMKITTNDEKKKIHFSFTLPLIYMKFYGCHNFGYDNL